MILFWVICGCLLLIALSFVLPPLLKRPEELSNEAVNRQEANIEIYRDQLLELEADLKNGIVSPDQYDRDKEEIQRRLLEDTKVNDATEETSEKQVSRSTAKQHSRTMKVEATEPTDGKERKTVANVSRSTVYVVAVGIPLVAVLFYLRVGELKGLSHVASAPPTQTAPAMTDTARSQQQIEANVAALAKRLQENPSDGEGWHSLARAYSAMERWAEASQAYEKATSINSNDADLWAEYAFATAMASGRKLEGKPIEFVNKALKIDPDNLKALELRGSAAYQANNYKEAVEIWQRVLSKVPPGSEVAATLQSRIDDAKEKLNAK